MGTPKISIITPVYQGAAFIGEAIASVLAQTYPHWELIVVDDASTDNSVALVKQFSDQRIKLLRQERNQGMNAARQVGTGASTGEIIAFLDQSDRFHHDKLREHVRLFEQNSAIGATYNARFELAPSSQTVSNLWQPPKEITLPELVLGSPFLMSDTMLRRKWALTPEIWDDSYLQHMHAQNGRKSSTPIGNGREIVFFGRLHLAGCRFAGTTRALNYRRLQQTQPINELAQRCKVERFSQEIILSDPRCPEEVRRMHPMALMKTYLAWSGNAFAQGDNGLGGEYLSNAALYNPNVLQGRPAPIVESLVNGVVESESANHEDLLEAMFSHFPREMAHLRSQLDWAIARGYLLKGAKALLWNQFDVGAYNMHRAIALRAELDDAFFERLNFQLHNYQREYGDDAAYAAVDRWKPFLDALGDERNIRRLLGKSSANQAMSNYHSGNYALVPAKVIQAFRQDPRLATNRGMLSILVKSVLSVPFRRKATKV